MLDVFALESPAINCTRLLRAAPETFDKFVNGGKHALVEFYAPWSAPDVPIVATKCICYAGLHRPGCYVGRSRVCRCGHCKHLTPEYKTLGETVAKDPKLKDSVVIAKVNQRCR